MMKSITKTTIATIALLLISAPAYAAGGAGGFPLTDWLVSIGNMLIFIGIIVYFGRAAIREHFETRRADLVANLDAAKVLREEAEAKLAEYQTRLDTLEDERKQLLDEYHAQGEAEKEKIIEDAKKQVEKLRNDAEVIIEGETRRAIARLEQQAVDLAVNMASDKLRDAIDDKVDAAIVDRFVGDVRNSEAA